METNTIIAEILKDKPEGTKLHSPLFGKCTFLKIYDSQIYILHHNNTVSTFYSNGTYFKFSESEPLLFPSKEMRNWSKFAWKKGDVLVSKGKRTLHVIFEGFNDDTYTTFKGKHYLCGYSDKEDYDEEYYNDYHKEVNERTIEFEKDNVNKARIYINIIERKLGGKLNCETLEIEKQPEFKDGDIVVYKCEIEDVPDVIFIFKLTPYYSYYASLDSDGFLSYKLGAFGIYNRELRLATEEEKQQLFDALAKEGKAWDAKKKQVVDLKPKVRFKPFDKVVAYCEITNEWSCDIFSHYAKNYEDKEVITCLGGGTYYKALPYNEETAKLLGTTDNVED